MGSFPAFPPNDDNLRALADPLAVLSNLFACAPVGLAIWHADGRPLLANDSARALFAPAPPAIGRADFERALGGENVEVEAAVAATVFPVRGADAKVEYVAATFRAPAQEPAEARALRRLKESGVIGIVASDTAGNITEANDAFLEMVGYTRDDLQAGLVTGKTLNTPERMLTDAAAFEQLKENGVAHAWEKELLHKDGRRIPVLMGVVLTNDEMTKSMAFALDLTQRKRAEAAVRESEAHAARAELLRREKDAVTQANTELEAFSYSVAHDLRSPLRTINGFSSIVLEENAEKLDEHAKSLLRRSIAAAARMGELIDALLNLARLSRTEVKLEQVDLSLLASSVVEQLRASEPTREVAVDIAEGMTATGDRDLLRAALENLIGNAWKFTRNVEHARIDLGWSTGDGETRYYVRDNGAGFDMKHAGRLFGAFQRLHTAKQFEGTGVGLATVERIVKRHGGRIWPEAAENQGATFHFTLRNDKLS